MATARRLAAILVALVALVAVAAAQQRLRQTDRDRDELLGRIKTVTVAVALPGDPTRFEPVEESTYTANGSLSERVSYVDGAVASRVTFRDDPATGALLAASTTPEGMGYGIRGTRLQPREQPGAPFAAAADGTYAFVLARTFDTAGRLLSETVHPGADPKTVGAPLARIVFRYDPQGRLGEAARYYGQPGAPFEKETFAYGPDGRVVESVRYRLTSVLPSRRTYVYETDAQGNWIKRTETQQLGGQPIVTVTTRKIAYF